MLCTAGAFGQAPAAQTDEMNPESKSATPVAFVYVTNTTNPGALYYKNNLYAFTAAANGKLTPVSASPFSDDIFTMAVNGKYLFGGDGNTGNIDTFLMATGGALEEVETTDPASFSPGECGNFGDFTLDHSGTVLYNVDLDADCQGTHFQYFQVQSATGKLDYVGDSEELMEAPNQLHFLADNKYGYAPSCPLVDTEASADVYGLQRHSSGELTVSFDAIMDGLGGNPSLGPVAPAEAGEPFTYYCPMDYATDPTNHIAAVLQVEDGDGNTYGNPVIGVYTAGSNGKLTTTNTSQDMPQVVPGSALNQIRVSPSGKLVAVGGLGLEIFHFNGANPVTKYKELLSGENIQQIYWDNNNHLYAVGVNNPGSGKLWVYSVTPTSVTEAQGSPYSIPNPYGMIVQSK
jgi:6-phosphogluconolactonase (cycloisomerase 2 family)